MSRTRRGGPASASCAAGRTTCFGPTPDDTLWLWSWARRVLRAASVICGCCPGLPVLSLAGGRAASVVSCGPLATAAASFLAEALQQALALARMLSARALCADRRSTKRRRHLSRRPSEASQCSVGFVPARTGYGLLACTGASLSRCSSATKAKA